MGEKGKEKEQERIPDVGLEIHEINEMRYEISWLLVLVEGQLVPVRSFDQVALEYSIFQLFQFFFFISPLHSFL